MTVYFIDRFFRAVLLAILVIQLLLVVGIVVFSAVSLQYIKDFVKITAISRYRDDVDLQNFIDWLQVGHVCLCCIKYYISSLLNYSL